MNPGAVHHRESCAVIAAILKPGETLQKTRRYVTLSQDAYNATHVNLTLSGKFTAPISFAVRSRVCPKGLRAMEPDEYALKPALRIRTIAAFCSNCHMGWPYSAEGLCSLDQDHHAKVLKRQPQDQKLLAGPCIRAVSLVDTTCCRSQKTGSEGPYVQRPPAPRLPHWRSRRRASKHDQSGRLRSCLNPIKIASIWEMISLCFIRS